MNIEFRWKILSKTFLFHYIKKKEEFNIIDRIALYNRSLQFLQKFNFKTFIIKLLLSLTKFFIVHRMLYNVSKNIKFEKNLREVIIGSAWIFNQPSRQSFKTSRKSKFNRQKRWTKQGWNVAISHPSDFSTCNTEEHPYDRTFRCLSNAAPGKGRIIYEREEPVRNRNGLVYRMCAVQIAAINSRPARSNGSKKKYHPPCTPSLVNKTRQSNSW